MRESLLHDNLKKMEESLFIAQGQSHDIDLSQLYFKLEKVEKAMGQAISGKEVDIDWLVDDAQAIG